MTVSLQNTSHAVRSQRVERRDSLDDFPTPPWATRALAEEVLGGRATLGELTVLEPACGRGHMANTLGEYFGEVSASDIHGYGYGMVCDFLTSDHTANVFDWIITNPPFRLAEEFILRSLPLARCGVAVLVRTVFTESVGRYQRLFSIEQPSRVIQFCERVPMIKGRVDKAASTATGYAWILWERDHSGPAYFEWVPPCRKRLEKPGDYDPCFLDGKHQGLPARQKDLFT